MAKALKTIGMIAGAVALVATGVGAFAGAAFAASATGAAVASVATYAGLAATAANIGASLLAKPPSARGSVAQLLISPEAPQPYVMGEGLFGGVLRHDAAYGPTLKKVPNPYRWMAVVYSGGGPVESIVPYVDKAPVSSWYAGFLYTSSRLGLCPDTALEPNWAGAPGWSASSKLSGQAAIGWSLKFDKDGKRFASGVPPLAAYGKWVKVYDPRKDSTMPGGSGAHRLGQESTYEWSENPALHAGTYAFGRFQNGKRVFGCGLAAHNIDWACIAAWANVCEANDWTLFGPIYEPGDRWANLKQIAEAGGAQPVAGSGGKLSFRYSAPVVALDTITSTDIAEGAIKYTTVQSWSERINTIIPKYISPEHEWQMMPAEAVKVAEFVTADGEEKAQEWPFNLVKDKNQAAQLAAYKLRDSREINPIVLPCTMRMRRYRPGECLHINLPAEGLVTDAVILQRAIDPATMTVTLTLIAETPGKHAFALGRVGVAAPLPVDGLSGEQRDEMLAAATGTNTATHWLISKTVAYPATSTDTSIVIEAFDGVVEDGRTIAFPAVTITGLASDVIHAVLWDATDNQWLAIPGPATAEMADATHVFLGWVLTSSGGAYTPPDPPPDGWGGDGGFYATNPMV